MRVLRDVCRRMKRKERKETARKLVRNPGKATLQLAWKICKVLIAFYNYLGAGRLSYPIHSRSARSHPLHVLAPSANIPPSTPRASLSLSLGSFFQPSHFLRRSLPFRRFLLLRPARKRARTPAACMFVFLCVYTRISEEIVPAEPLPFLTSVPFHHAYMLLQRNKN